MRRMHFCFTNVLTTCGICSEFRVRTNYIETVNRKPLFANICQIGTCYSQLYIMALSNARFNATDKPANTHIHTHDNSLSLNSKTTTNLCVYSKECKSVFCAVQRLLPSSRAYGTHTHTHMRARQLPTFHISIKYVCDRRTNACEEASCIYV